jgi:hypothetical protein
MCPRHIVCFRYIVVNILPKGDNESNNNNNKNKIYCSIYLPNDVCTCFSFTKAAKLQEIKVHKTRQVRELIGLMKYLNNFILHVIQS